MFSRKRRNHPPPEPAAPPYMHASDAAGELELLMRRYTLERGALVAHGLPVDNPRLLGLDAQIEACRRSLVAVRVTSIAIERSESRGRMHG